MAPVKGPFCLTVTDDEDTWGRHNDQEVVTISIGNLGSDNIPIM